MGRKSDNRWVRIAGRDFLNGPDQVTRTNAKGKHLCLVKDNGEIYATQLSCPHAGADLSSGWCKNGQIVCPYHRHEFDLRTGRGAVGQNNSVRTYRVETREDGIYVLIPPPWWKFW